MAKRHKMLNITIRERQIRTTVKHHLTPGRLAVTKEIHKFWHVDKGEPA